MVVPQAFNRNFNQYHQLHRAPLMTDEAFKESWTNYQDLFLTLQRACLRCNELTVGSEIRDRETRKAIFLTLSRLERDLGALRD